MSLDVREVHRIATLARLRLEPEQERRFAEQLARVVDWIDQIRAADGGPAVPAAALAGPEAADEVAPGLDRARFLDNAPAVEGPFLVVPRVIGGGDG